MSDVLAEAQRLSELFGLSLASIQHAVLEDDVELHSGPPNAQTIGTLVPDGQIYVVTRVDFEGYPLDSVGTHLFGERRPGVYADAVSCLWEYNGSNQNVYVDHHNYKGPLFLVCPKGTVKLHLKYLLVDSGPLTQKIFVRISGFLIDVREGASGGSIGQMSTHVLETLP